MRQGYGAELWGRDTGRGVMGQGYRAQGYGAGIQRVGVTRFSLSLCGELLFFCFLCPVFSVLYFCSSRMRSYESSDEMLPHTPRLTRFPTVSGSPASLANSMQSPLSSSPRRRHHALSTF